MITEEKYSRTIKEFESGDVFGERELVLNLLRETKAVANHDRTVLYLFGKEEFNEILSSKEKEEFLYVMIELWPHLKSRKNLRLRSLSIS